VTGFSRLSDCHSGPPPELKVAGSNPAGHTFQPTIYGDPGTHQGSLAHALPTSHVADPDLDLIVRPWGRLSDLCKRELVAMVWANLPSQGDEDVIDERDA
jgi:hypothetical protein